MTTSEISNPKDRFGLANIIGISPRMIELKEFVRRVSRSDNTILLLGESGSGKDMLARAVHYESARIDRPFVNVTCTALPESLLESELFGYEKGAFTDAKALKKGLFEVAEGGTIFLDEIGDMRPPLQSRLLRVLEEKSFRRVGGTADIKVNVRVIAATNRNLDEAIGLGRFREDLYYRLSALPVVVPPLRERKQDIPLLADHFLRNYTLELHQNVKRLDPDTSQKLMDYAWPGNVRELKNAIERAVLMSTEKVITPDDIVLGRAGARVDDKACLVLLPQDGCRLDEVEQELIQQALERTNNNQTHAAKLLGISRDQIRYKMTKYRL